MQEAAEKRRVLYVLILGIPTLAVLPAILFGYPRGHDFPFHMTSWVDFIQHWREGTFFPGWAAWANYGFGEPRFIFYPPLSRLVAAASAFILPWQVVPGVFVWLMVAIAGCSMYRLARLTTGPDAALKIGVLYASNPYLLLVAYQRAALAELMASAIFPLVVLAVLRLSKRSRNGVVPLAASVGVIWLANAPSGVIVTYCVILVAGFWAILHRNGRILLHAAVAIALGLGLAAFYIVPAFYEQQWVNIASILAPVNTPAVNFFFSTDPHVRVLFNRVVSLTAAAQWTLLTFAFSRPDKYRSSDPLFRVLFVLAIVSIVLMIPWSLPLWTTLPGMQFVQFPWRWLFVFNVGFAFFIGSAFHKRTNGWILTLLLALFTGFCASRSGWNSQGARRAKEAIDLRQGYAGVEEYAPTGSDIQALVPGVSEVVLESGSSHIEQWSGEKKVFTADTPAPAQAFLRLLAYPAWTAAVNGVPTPITTKPGTGQAVLSLPSGHSRVQLEFRTTPDRVYGFLLSVLTASVLVLFWLFEKWNQYRLSGRRSPMMR